MMIMIMMISISHGENNGMAQGSQKQQSDKEQGSAHPGGRGPGERRQSSHQAGPKAGAEVAVE